MLKAYGSSLARDWIVAAVVAMPDPLLWAGELTYTSGATLATIVGFLNHCTTAGTPISPIYFFIQCLLSWVYPLLVIAISAGETKVKKAYSLPPVVTICMTRTTAERKEVLGKNCHVIHDLVKEANLQHIKWFKNRGSCRGSVVNEHNYEDMGSIPGFTQWARIWPCCDLRCRSQTRLRSLVVVVCGIGQWL